MGHTDALLGANGGLGGTIVVTLGLLSYESDTGVDLLRATKCLELPTSDDKTLSLLSTIFALVRTSA